MKKGYMWKLHNSHYIYINVGGLYYTSFPTSCKWKILNEKLKKGYIGKFCKTQIKCILLSAFKQTTFLTSCEQNSHKFISLSTKTFPLFICVTVNICTLPAFYDISYIKYQLQVGQLHSWICYKQFHFIFNSEHKHT